MPYTSLSSVPSNIAKHKGIKLTLAQANFWAKIYDGVKNNPEVEIPAAVAWAQFEKRYMIKGNRWVLRKKPATKNEDRHDNLTWEIEADRLTADCPLCDDNVENGTLILEVQTGGMVALKNELHNEGLLFETQPVPPATPNAFGAKIIQAFKCDKYACYVKEEGGKEVAYLHFTAVTTKESNRQRFPEKILKRDIKTLEDKPFVDWHSEWPEKRLSNFDIIGSVVKAWYNTAKKWAEVVVKIWRKQIVELIKERKKNGKLLITHVSVGYRHKFHKEGNIKVSDKIEFHHLGYLPKADAADKEAEALTIDESLMDGIATKSEDYDSYEAEWTKEITEFVAEGKAMAKKWICECLDCGHKIKTSEHCDDLECPECGGKMRRLTRPGAGQKIIIMDKDSVQDLLGEHPAKAGEVAWLVFQENETEKYWNWYDVIVSEDEPTDEFLLSFLYKGTFRMFKVGKSIAEEGTNYGRIMDLPQGHRDFKITMVIKSESTIKSAGSSTVEAKTMDEKEQKKMEEDLAAAKKELEANAKELETAQAELKAKTEELETNESAVKEKSDALDAALKEKTEADTAKEEAEKAKKDAEVLLQQEKEKQLEVKVEELVKSGQIEASKKEDTLNLLKPLDEEGQTKFLNVLETKAKAVPVGEEEGREEAEKELGADGLMPDAKADALSKEMYGVGYKELVEGVKSGGESK